MLQQRLFNDILKKHKTQAEALKSVGDLLNLSRSNAYRRVNGDITLKPKEITLLARHYHISLDELIGKNSSHFPVQYYKLVYGPERSLVDDVKATTNLYARFKSCDDAHFYYVNSDIPFPLFSYFPELFYLKSLQWYGVQKGGKTAASIDFSAMGADFIAGVKKLNYYNRTIRSTEVFSNNTFSLVLNQIRYAHDIGKLNNDNLRVIIDRLYDLIRELYTIAKRETKLEGQEQNVEFYYNPLPNNVNHILAHFKNTPSLNHVTVTYDSPGFIQIFDKKMVARSLALFDTIKALSQKISGTDEVTRRMLFTRYRNQVRRVERELLPIIV